MEHQSWDDLQEPQRLPSSKLWYLEGWYNQDEESKKKSWGNWIEEGDNIIWDPLDLNWLWPIHMEIWVWSIAERSWWIWGITDYMWELKPRMGFPGGSVSKKKKSIWQAGDVGSIPGSGRSPGEENGNPLQYSCLENFIDRGAWKATVHGVANCWTWLRDCCCCC